MPSTEGPLPDWNRAYGSPLFQGLIKNSCSDFIVTELLDFDLSGDGEHDYLWLQKEDANTAWVARALASHAGVVARDVGYAGLKDRQAVTRQWFSVRRPTGEGTDWEPFELPGVTILEQTRHLRKLKRGAHQGNHFRIAVRGADTPAAVIEERLAAIRAAGVPNYFGPQRFGRDGNNLQLAQVLFAGKRLKREKRSIALSAARSFIFNEVLSTRIAAGNWNVALPGEALNLEGSGSIFIAEEIDDEITERVRTMDIHPTAVMWGKGEPKCGGEPADIEREVVDRAAELATGLESHGLERARRATRLVVQDLKWELEGDTLWLDFRLGRGAFATSVLREIVN